MSTLAEKLMPLIDGTLITKHQREDLMEALEDEYEPLKLDELIALSSLRQNYLLMLWHNKASGWNGILGENDGV